jgi:hypothetical protein
MLSPWAATTAELKVQFSGRYCHGLGNLDVGIWRHDGTPISTPKSDIDTWTPGHRLDFFAKQLQRPTACAVPVPALPGAPGQP